MVRIRVRGGEENKGRVELEPILFTSNFWRAKNWQKFRKFQNLAVVALDEHVLTKTSLIDRYVTRSTELTLRRFFPTLHVPDSPLSAPTTSDFCS